MGHWADGIATPPKIRHQGPLHGGEERPGESGSSPSTKKADYLGLADQQSADVIAPALLSLKRLVRGVY